jgi:uncharacterized protein (TIGR02996 family)
MTDGDALLKAIIAHPAEDTPRLVYADWLQEQGQEVRAEFIRVQIDIEAYPPLDIGGGETIPSPKQAAVDLRRRIKELWDQVGGFGVPVGIGTSQVTWRRGFVESLEVTWDSWRDHAEAITKAHPIEKVKLTTWPNPEDRRGWSDDDFRKQLTTDWPGIEFELPPAQEDDTLTDEDEFPSILDPEEVTRVWPFPTILPDEP